MQQIPLTPLRLTTTVKPLVFGGHVLADDYRRPDLPDHVVGETWEVSDVDGNVSVVADGPLAGTTLRDLVTDRPEELMGAGWSGDRFPVLTKFIDASGTLPVHLHADDDHAQRLEGQANGKTEAWHILRARPGATAICGVRDGVDAPTLRRALLDGAFDRVLRRIPVRAGTTVYVPGGTVHSFGPGTLVYEIEQTSDIQQHAMPWNMEDGSPVPDDERAENIDRLLEEWDPTPQPVAIGGLGIRVDDDTTRTVLCAGPFFALERWTTAAEAMTLSVLTGTVLSNAGERVTVTAGDWTGVLERASSLLVPAAVGEVRITGPADVLVGYLPDLERDVRAPLLAAGHGDAAITALGEGLDGARNEEQDA